jgi:hypothetical protein
MAGFGTASFGTGRLMKKVDRLIPPYKREISARDIGNVDIKIYRFRRVRAGGGDWLVSSAPVACGLASRRMISIALET